jgi:hypothetical protein
MVPSDESSKPAAGLVSISFLGGAALVLNVEAGLGNSFIGGRLVGMTFGITERLIEPALRIGLSLRNCSSWPDSMTQ